MTTKTDTTFLCTVLTYIPRDYVKFVARYVVNKEFRERLEGNTTPGAGAVTTNILNPLNAELNPICHLLALLAHPVLHISRIRVNFNTTLNL